MGHKSNLEEVKVMIAGRHNEVPIGIILSGESSMQQDVVSRIGCECRVIGRTSQVPLRRELSRQTKLKEVKVTVMLALIYGCEAWAVHKEQKAKIQAMQMNILKRMQGVCWKD